MDNGPAVSRRSLSTYANRGKRLPKFARADNTSFLGPAALGPAALGIGLHAVAHPRRVAGDSLSTSRDAALAQRFEIYPPAFTASSIARARDSRMSQRLALTSAGSNRLLTKPTAKAPALR